jgi:hypothetical protein
VVSNDDCEASEAVMIWLIIIGLVGVVIFGLLYFFTSEKDSGKVQNRADTLQRKCSTKMNRFALTGAF